MKQSLSSPSCSGHVFSHSDGNPKTDTKLHEAAILFCAFLYFQDANTKWKPNEYMLIVKNGTISYLTFINKSYQSIYTMPGYMLRVYY